MLMTEGHYPRMDGFDAMGMLPLGMGDGSTDMHNMLHPSHLDTDAQHDFDPRVFSPLVRACVSSRRLAFANDTYSQH